MYGGHLSEYGNKLVAILSQKVKQLAEKRVIAMIVWLIGMSGSAKRLWEKSLQARKAQAVYGISRW